MYQHIMVESGAKVFQKNNRLCIEKGVLHELPAEDIATVVLDNSGNHHYHILPGAAFFARDGGYSLQWKAYAGIGSSSLWRQFTAAENDPPSNFSKEAAPEAALAAGGEGKDTKSRALSGILR